MRMLPVRVVLRRGAVPGWVNPSLGNAGKTVSLAGPYSFHAAMKRLLSLVLMCSLLASISAPLSAATQAEAVSAPGDNSAALTMAETLTAVTGMAISPLLGTGAYGAYQYFKTPAEHRASLPWFAKLGFWVPALLLVGACAAKDALGAALPPGWKKPLDILETVENKATGLVAAGAVVPFTLSAMSKVIMGGELAASASHPVLVPSGLAAIQVAAIDGTWLLNILTVPFGVVVFVLVWMAAHTINVLILISPWGAIDAALKAVRTGVLGLLTASAAIDPKIGAALSVVIIVIAYFVAGWSFRLTVFGSLFSWDFFTLRRRRFTVAENGNKAFSAGLLKTANVPLRTYGRLCKAADGKLEFVFKPWLVLAEKRIPIEEPADLIVGEGLFFSLIQKEDGGLFFLPPRYRSHEGELAAAYGFKGVEPAGLNKAWSWIRETMGFSTKVAPVGGM